MTNQNIDMHISALPALQLLMRKQRQPNISDQKLGLFSRKRSSSDVCSNSSDCSLSTTSSCAESPMKRLRPTEVCYETKVQPSKVGIAQYETNDVLSGRGGGTNQHEGNCFFRSLINKNRERYLRAKKNDKPFISLSIVNIVRQKNGRFLKKDEESGLWFEIGDAQAREKTSQALRQRAPEYRKQLLKQDGMLSQQAQLIQQSPLPPLSSVPPSTPPLCSVTQQVQKVLEARARQQSEIQEARKVIRLHQKIQAMKVLELELMLQSSSRYLLDL